MPKFTFKIMVPDTVTVEAPDLTTAIRKGKAMLDALGRDAYLGSLLDTDHGTHAARPLDYDEPAPITDALIDAAPPPSDAPVEYAVDPSADKTKPDLDFGDAVFLRSDPKHTVGMCRGPVVTGVLSGDVRYEVMWADTHGADGTARTWHPRGELIYCGWQHPAFIEAVDASRSVPSPAPSPVSASRRPLIVPDTAGELPQGSCTCSTGPGAAIPGSHHISFCALYEEEEAHA